MNGLLRHFAVRLWLTALLGSLCALIMLPFWQTIFHLQWQGVPVAAFFLTGFVFLGWTMNRLGIARIKKIIHEAGIWQRAGGMDAALLEFNRAMAVFDSFWLSPAGRRIAEDLITTPLVRFYLSTPILTRQGRRMVKRYLSRHPQDTAIAHSWLEQLTNHAGGDVEDDLLATRISQALADDPQIQLLLMQHYLAEQRWDFEALQVYRRAWAISSDLPDESVQAMVRVLLNHGQLSDFALQVYLRGYHTGDPYSLEGIVAAVQYLRPHPGNQKDLAIAGHICDNLDVDFRFKAAGRFKAAAGVMALGPSGSKTSPSKAVPDQDLPPDPLSPEAFVFRDTTPDTILDDDLPEPGRRASASAVLSRLGQVGRGLAGAGKRALAGSTHAILGLQRLFGAVGRRRWPVLKMKPIGIVSVVVIALVAAIVAGYQLRGRPAPQSEDVVPVNQALPEIQRPFTIQVAAYLKPEDAEQYVAALKSRGLEAFSSQAVSSHRKWYQVKVSRFETKVQAREYGEKLKSQGVIDDFYVANYQQQ